MRFHGTLLVACTLTFVALPASSQKRGVTSEDYFAFGTATDPRLSPDGKLVAYVLTTVDQARNRRDTSIWVVATDGQSAPRRLTAEGVNSSSPSWSPDGSRLAFLSDRGSAEPAHPQICVLPMSGGEATVLSHLKNGASALQWSPDGKRFVALSQTGPSDDVAPAARKSDVRHYSHIVYNFNDTAGTTTSAATSS